MLLRNTCIFFSCRLTNSSYDTYHNPLLPSIPPVLDGARPVDRHDKKYHKEEHDSDDDRKHLLTRALGLLGGLLAVASYTDLVGAVKVVVITARTAQWTWKWGIKVVSTD